MKREDIRAQADFPPRVGPLPAHLQDFRSCTPCQTLAFTLDVRRSHHTALDPKPSRALRDSPRAYPVPLHRTSTLPLPSSMYEDPPYKEAFQSTGDPSVIYELMLKD